MTLKRVSTAIEGRIIIGMWKAMDVPDRLVWMNAKLSWCSLKK